MKDKNNALPILCDTCGGPLRYSSDGLEAACPYCGNRYNFRGGRSEALSLALSRANSYRLNCDFSEAEREYSLILERNPQDAEAHWGMVLSKDLYVGSDVEGKVGRGLRTYNIQGAVQL